MRESQPTLQAEAAQAVRPQESVEDLRNALRGRLEDCRLELAYAATERANHAYKVVFHIRQPLPQR